MIKKYVVQTVSSRLNLSADEWKRAFKQMGSLEGGECKQTGWVKGGSDDEDPSYSAVHLIVLNRQSFSIFQVGQTTKPCDNPFLFACRAMIHLMQDSQSYCIALKASSIQVLEPEM